MKKLTHTDKDGQPGMVDISQKSVSERIAEASAMVVFPSEVMKQLKDSNFTNHKGSIIQTAIIAGTMAVKNTSQMIPFCHQIPISSCKIHTTMNATKLHICCIVKTTAQTGVEMEALTGASVAALTVYDMTKALSHDIRITDIQLERKSGGKNDFKR